MKDRVDDESAWIRKWRERLDGFDAFVEKAVIE